MKPTISTNERILGSKQCPAPENELGDCSGDTATERQSAVALHALVRSVRDTNGTVGMDDDDFMLNVEKLCNFALALQAELDGADKVIANFHAQASNVKDQP